MLYSYIIMKCCLIGDTGVGKTSICTRFFNDKFYINNESTLGACYTNIKLKDNNNIDFWDTAGQERYASLLPMYTRSADIIIIVFDYSFISSYDNVTKWINLLKNNHDFNSYIIFLIGNKTDLVSNNEIKLRENHSSFIQDHIHFFFNVSFKENINIDLVFRKLILEAKRLSLKKVNNKSQDININKVPTSNNYKCCNIN